MISEGAHLRKPQRTIAIAKNVGGYEEGVGLKMVEQRAVEVLYDEWQKLQERKERGEAAAQGIGTERVYQRLLEEGWDVPAYMLNKLWESLAAFDQIRGQRLDDGGGLKLHGATLITWVSATLLEDTQRHADDSFYWPA